MKKTAIFASVVLAAACGLAPAQEAGTKPVTVGRPMPDFTLPAYQGGTVTLSALKGKNVMIIFPRGYAAENYWCTICNYKYAELIEQGKQSMERSRGPVGIRLSVHGPGCFERDEVSLGAAGGAFQSVDVRAAIDIAAQPAIYYRHGYEGKFIGRRDRSQRRTKRKIL